MHYNIYICLACLHVQVKSNKIPLNKYRCILVNLVGVKFILFSVAQSYPPFTFFFVNVGFNKRYKSDAFHVFLVLLSAVTVTCTAATVLDHHAFYHNEHLKTFTFNQTMLNCK